MHDTKSGGPISQCRWHIQYMLPWPLIIILANAQGSLHCSEALGITASCTSYQPAGKGQGKGTEKGRETTLEENYILDPSTFFLTVQLQRDQCGFFGNNKYI